MEFKAQKLIKKASIWIGKLAFFIGLIIAINQFFLISKDYFDNTIGHKYKMLQRIEKLSADVNIGYFKELIGSPVFINDLENNDNEAKKEYIFVDNLFYLQAIADKTDKVLAYSITSRKSDFNPKIKFSSYQVGEKPILIELAKSRFSELGNEQPRGIISSLGAHDFFYTEAYYFGNPGNYQTYFFGLNESGYGGIGEKDSVIYPPDRFKDNDINIDDKDIQEFRGKAIINTYGVAGPFVINIFKNIKDSKNNNLIPGGPDYNQTRIFKN